MSIVFSFPLLPNLIKINKIQIFTQMSHVIVLNNAESECNRGQCPKQIFINIVVSEMFSCSQQVVYKWKPNKDFYQWELTCSNSTIKTLEQGAKNVQSYQ